MRQQDLFSTAAHAAVITLLEKSLHVHAAGEAVRRRAVGDWLRQRGDILVQQFVSAGRTGQITTQVDVDPVTSIYVTVEEVQSLGGESALRRWVRRLRGIRTRRFLVKFLKVKSATKSVNVVSS